MALHRLAIREVGHRVDAVAQLAGGALGVVLAELLLGPMLAHSAVCFAVTIPRAPGPWVAFAAELTISFILMLAILTTSNHRQLHRWTPWCAAALVVTWIVVEAPLSGMSMNPARTAASAFRAGVWTGWWIYLIAPALGMFAASRVWLAWRGAARVYCAKLNHENDRRCIFLCNFGAI